MITVWIDDFTPCLKDDLTGESVEHYQEVFNAQHIGMLHPYQVFIDSSDTAKIREVYNYEWTNEEL